jgi:RHS repeat-associated protein
MRSKILVALSCLLLACTTAFAGARLRQPAIERSDVHLAAKNPLVAVADLEVYAAVSLKTVSEEATRADEGAPGEKAEQLVLLVASRWTVAGWESGCANSVIYAYDINHKRTTNTDSGTYDNIVYYYHGSQVIAIGLKDPQGDITWTHAIGRGPMGPCFLKDLTGNGPDYFIFTDHLGTPFAWHNPDTNETFYTPFNPWGELLATSPTRAPPYQHGNIPTTGFTLPTFELFDVTPLGLAGHIYDERTGLTYMHHRYYHPRLGHFLTPDFRAPDIYDPSTFTEPYAYAAGNPVMFWDSDGLAVARYFNKGKPWETIELEIHADIMKLIAQGQPFKIYDEERDIVFAFDAIDPDAGMSSRAKVERIRKAFANIGQVFLEEKWAYQDIGGTTELLATISIEGSMMVFGGGLGIDAGEAVFRWGVKGISLMRGARIGQFAGRMKKAVGGFVSGAAGWAGRQLDKIPMPQVQWMEAAGDGFGFRVPHVSFQSSASRTSSGVLPRFVRKGVERLKQFDIDYYGNFNTPGRRGDKLIGHELLQNAWLKAKGLTKGHGVDDISKLNPAVAVTKPMHTKINKLQRQYGLWNPKRLAEMKADEVIDLNVRILREVGIPEEVIQVLLREARSHARTVSALL